jgi:hypothetical protein
MQNTIISARLGWGEGEEERAELLAKVSTSIFPKKFFLRHPHFSPKNEG